MSIRAIAKIADVPNRIRIPDMLVMFIMGIVGYSMRLLGIPATSRSS